MRRAAGITSKIRPDFDCHRHFRNNGKSNLHQDSRFKNDKEEYVVRFPNSYEGHD